MKRIAIFLTTTAFVCLMVNSVGAKELTLDDCVKSALENRASIIAARGFEQQASAGKRSALGAFLPSIRGSYSFGKGKDTEIDPPNMRLLNSKDTIFTTIIDGDTAKDVGKTGIPQIVDEQDIGPNKTWNIRADLQIFDPASWFTYGAAGAELDRRKLDVLASEQDLIFAVKTAYFAHLAVVENVSVQEDALERAEEQLKLIESRYELGSASLSDVLKQKVQSGNDRLELLRARNAVINSNANLAYTIGLDPREDYEFLANHSVTEYDGTLDQAVDFGVVNNPRLLASEKNLLQANQFVMAAKSAYLPTVNAYASFTKFKGTQAFPFAFDFSQNTTAYGFGVSYAIFDGFTREKRVTDAKVFRNNARADIVDTRNRTVSDIKTAYLDIQLTKEQMLVSTENVAAAGEDLKITQEKYNLGAATILDLLDAQVSLKQAQVALIRVELDLRLAEAKLEAAMGKM